MRSPKIMVQLQNQFLENSPVARNGPMVAEELPEPDVQIITSGGRSIPAHSRVLVFFLFLNPQNSIYCSKISTGFFIWVLGKFFTGFGIAGDGEINSTAAKAPEL